MIGRLTGTIVEQAFDGACLIEVGGVGYEVWVPLGTVGQLPRSPGQATLHVHTHLREDALTLYGFAQQEDRAAFRTLLGVTGVGPRLALAILSQLNASELADAIHRGDRARFKGISGVGKKIVERLVLELTDKLPAGPSSSMVPAAPAGGIKAVAGEPLAAVHGALLQMGFKSGEAEGAVQRLTPEAEGKATEELLREALVLLA